MSDLIETIRYWLLRKLKGVDAGHHRFMLDTCESISEQLRKEGKEAQAQIKAMEAAYHDLNPSPDSFYSWQRDYQDLARHVLELPDDASVETIATALLMRRSGT